MRARRLLRGELRGIEQRVDALLFLREARPAQARRAAEDEARRAAEAEEEERRAAEAQLEREAAAEEPEPEPALVSEPGANSELPIYRWFDGK